MLLNMQTISILFYLLLRPLKWLWSLVWHFFLIEKKKECLALHKYSFFVCSFSLNKFLFFTNSTRLSAKIRVHFFNFFAKAQVSPDDAVGLGVFAWHRRLHVVYAETTRLRTIVGYLSFLEGVARFAEAYFWHALAQFFVGVTFFA